MRKVIFCAVLFFASAPFSASAQVRPYTDLALGAAFPSEVETKEVSFTFDGDDIAGTAAINYNPSLAAGVEWGMQGLFKDRVRLGLSYDYIRAKVDNLSLAGTVNGTPDSLVIPSDDLEAAGVQLGQDEHYILGNGYFVFPTGNSRIEPYIGGGVGVAFIEHTDSQFAYSGTAGARVYFRQNAYIGFRYRFIRVSELNNDLVNDFGLEIDATHRHVASFVFGAYY